MTWAITFIDRLSKSKNNPTAMYADNSAVPGVASRKLLAMSDAIVWLGLKSEVGIADGPMVFPMTMVTAIVSPTALPRPRMTAPKIPERP